MRALLAALLALLAACQPFRPALVPPPATPAAYTSPQGTWTVPAQWWTAWNATELAGLVDRALAQGHDVALARARLAQAQAAARKARSALFPGLDAELAPERRTSGGAGRDTAAEPLWSLTGLASYEVDLWGEVAAQTEVAELAVRQGEEALRTAAMTVAAETATAWLDLVSARIQADVLARQVAEHERLLASLTDRYAAGMATRLDLEGQRRALAETRALMPPLVATQKARAAQLMVLCALNATDGLGQAPLPEPWPLPRAGLPADLLEARPDLRAKAAAAASAGLDLARAKADLLPRLTLTGRLTASGPSLGAVFDSWLTRLIAGLAAPILDGGRRLAEVDRARAAQEEAILAYGRAVAQAVAEADTALAEVQAAAQNLALAQERLDAAQAVLAATWDRYAAGMLGYPDVAAALLQAQAQERALVAQHAALLTRQVTLVRALGQGWQHLLPREVAHERP